MKGLWIAFTVVTLVVVALVVAYFYAAGSNEDYMLQLCDSYNAELINNTCVRDGQVVRIFR